MFGGGGGGARLSRGRGEAREFAYGLTFRRFKGTFTDYLRTEGLYTEPQMAPS